MKTPRAGYNRDSEHVVIERDGVWSTGVSRSSAIITIAVALPWRSTIVSKYNILDADGCRYAMFSILLNVMIYNELSPCTIAK